MNHRKLASVLRQTFSAWSDHDAPRLGAALAFYTILSLAPLLILIVAIAAFFFGHSRAEDQIIGQVQAMIGVVGASAVRDVIERAAQKPASGTLASIIGVLTLVFAASAVFGELRSALNTIWYLKPDTSGSLWPTIKRQFFSFGMVLVVGFLLLVSLVFSAALAVLGEFFGDILPFPAFALSGVNFVVSIAGIAFLFVLIFKYVPESKIPWKGLWLGAFATAFFFVFGKYLIGLYLGKAAVGSAYGAAGSLVVIIVWVYYSAMIFLFGAEFTAALQRAEEDQGT
ncbi:MAG: YihY/virulence factor BrkB family protein [Bryobacteraceae bacterium]